MRQVIIVLFALLAVSIFMPTILAKQEGTGPFLVGTTNMSKVAPTQLDPDNAIFGITKTMQDFLNGTSSVLVTNAQDVASNNMFSSMAPYDILNFLNSETIPTEDVFPTVVTFPSPAFKKHEMN